MFVANRESRQQGGHGYRNKDPSNDVSYPPLVARNRNRRTVSKRIGVSDCLGGACGHDEIDEAKKKITVSFSCCLWLRLGASEETHVKIRHRPASWKMNTTRRYFIHKFEKIYGNIGSSALKCDCRLKIQLTRVFRCLRGSRARSRIITMDHGVQKRLAETSSTYPKW